MNESILNSIKKLLGISPDDTNFDTDLIIGINAVFPTLAQIGVGDESGFMIFDSSTKWGDYIENDKMLNSVIMYVYIKTKLVFDPPSSSIVKEAMVECAKEYEWRIKLYVDTPSTESDGSSLDSDMDTIVRGTNDPIVLKTDIDTKQVVNASAILYQNNTIIKSWSFSDFKFGESEIILPLTEDDTLRLSPFGAATLETKWKYKDGNIDVGNDVNFKVINHMDDTRLD